MSEEQEEVDNSGNLTEHETTTRTAKGKLKPGFTPQTEAIYKKELEELKQSSPKESDFMKMNSILCKQLGIQGKLVDLQEKYRPRELFNQLNFMIENSSNRQGLPENQPIAPISPQPNKYDLPGKQLKKPILSKDGFSVSFQLDPKDLLQPKKNKK